MLNARRDPGTYPVAVGTIEENIEGRTSVSWCDPGYFVRAGNERLDAKYSTISQRYIFVASLYVLD